MLPARRLLWRRPVHTRLAFQTHVFSLPKKHSRASRNVKCSYKRIKIRSLFTTRELFTQAANMRIRIRTWRAEVCAPPPPPPPCFSFFFCVGKRNDNLSLLINPDLKKLCMYSAAALSRSISFQISEQPSHRVPPHFSAATLKKNRRRRFKGARK